MNALIRRHGLSYLEEGGCFKLPDVKAILATTDTNKKGSVFTEFLRAVFRQKAELTCIWPLRTKPSYVFCGERFFQIPVNVDCMADLTINLLIAFLHNETLIVWNTIRARTASAAKSRSIEYDFIFFLPLFSTGRRQVS